MPSGGYRPGAGRPRKNVIDKKLEGKPVSTGQPAPRPKKVASKNVMAEYFSMAMKECEKEVPSADVLRTEKDIAPTLQARDFKDAPAVMRGQYVVRRLIPAECAMLQGFPPDWCAGLETPEPTEEDIVFWSEIWETHRRIMGTSSKPKSRSQIIKWLQHPHTDSAEYMMWGNGISLNIVVFVLSGIVYYNQL